MLALRTALKAVTPAHSSGQASSDESSPGMCVTQSAGATMYCAKHPSTWTPVAWLFWQ